MPMSLKGAFAKVQHAGGQFYLKLSQSFEENPLIRETWAAMAQDLEIQAASLEGLQPRFWKMLKSEEQTLLGAVREGIPIQALERNEDKSLHGCFARCLEFEEPLILRAYVPLIRLLRTEWSDRALDFYIIVKSHVARISRMIQPFSGDPAFLQRAQNLQQQFEFDVQAPPARVIVAPPKQIQHKKKRHIASAAADKKSHKIRTETRSAARTHPLSERVQRLAKHGKTLVRKIELPRRRARRYRQAVFPRKDAESKDFCGLRASAPIPRKLIFHDSAPIL